MSRPRPAMLSRPEVTLEFHCGCDATSGPGWNTLTWRCRNHRAGIRRVETNFRKPLREELPRDDRPTATDRRYGR